MYFDSALILMHAFSEEPSRKKYLPNHEVHLPENF